MPLRNFVSSKGWKPINVCLRNLESMLPVSFSCWGKWSLLISRYDIMAREQLRLRGVETIWATDSSKQRLCHGIPEMLVQVILLHWGCFSLAAIHEYWSYFVGSERQDFIRRIDHPSLQNKISIEVRPPAKLDSSSPTILIFQSPQQLHPSSSWIPQSDFISRTTMPTHLHSKVCAWLPFFTSILHIPASPASSVRSCPVFASAIRWSILQMGTSSMTPFGWRNLEAPTKTRGPDHPSSFGVRVVIPPIWNFADASTLEAGWIWRSPYSGMVNWVLKTSKLASGRVHLNLSFNKNVILFRYAKGDIGLVSVCVCYSGLLFSSTGWVLYSWEYVGEVVLFVPYSQRNYLMKYVTLADAYQFSDF